MSEINLHEELSGIKTALSVFLTAYFDGAAHPCGGTPLVFPLVDVVFARPELAKALPRPVIYCVPVGGGLRRRRGASTLDGHAPWNIVVLALRQHEATVSGVVYRGGRLHDLIVSRIGLILQSCRYVLANAGLRVLHPGDAISVQQGEIFTSYRELRVYPHFSDVTNELVVVLQEDLLSVSQEDGVEVLTEILAT
jgi:hypothetical protein